jgi:hypothetical protein
VTTVCCLFVKGHVPYTAEYVERLSAMVRRWMDRPYRFVCLTDQPWLFSGDVETAVVQSYMGLKAWWTKLQMFNPERGWKGRVLYLDLDTLVVSSLAPVLDYNASFALAPHAGTFEGKDGLKVVKRFNSSVMVWDAGAADGLYEHWTPDVANRLWGDQDWIGERASNAATMPAEWFPRLSEIGQFGEVPVTAKVILAKKPKNHVAAQTWPWVNRVWRAA